MFKKMIHNFRCRLQNIGTIKTLCLQAEKYANEEGQKEPGTEHFVLAAIELPDGTARKAFERMQADPNSFRAAINQQYQDSLHNIGVDLLTNNAINNTTLPMPSGEGLYRGQHSAQILMQNMAKQLKDSSVPLLVGANVIIAATQAQHGVVIRALQSMGVSPINLAEAAKAEITTAI